MNDVNDVDDDDHNDDDISDETDKDDLNLHVAVSSRTEYVITKYKGFDDSHRLE
jgi:hypothetical protein